MEYSAMVRWLRHFARQDRGAVLAYVTIALPVLVGLGILAVDVSRLSNLSTSMQKGADALAIAGAAELDRSPTAITRANAAIANMVPNRSLLTGVWRQSPARPSSI
jgi:Flp pilus assembly protein TadG